MVERVAGVEPLGSDHPVFEALADLNHIAPHELEVRMASRLLVALAVLARIYPDELTLSQDGESAPPLALGLLPFRPGEVGEEPRFELHELLVDDEVFSSIDGQHDWEGFADFAVRNHALRSDVAEQPAPCTDSVVPEVVDGLATGVTRLATLITADVRDEDVYTFLKVRTWMLCNKLYCDIVDKGAKPILPGEGAVVECHEWTEVLSANCAKKDLVGEIRVCLVFTTESFDSTNTWFRMTYTLCPDHLDHGNRKVSVDRGEIIVRKQGSFWTFDTTKYLKFTGVADGAHLGLIACAFGYAAMAQNFLATCVPKQLPGSAPPGGSAAPSSGDAGEEDLA